MVDADLEHGTRGDGVFGMNDGIFIFLPGWLALVSDLGLLLVLSACLL